jgi:hypothetical protein
MKLGEANRLRFQCTGWRRWMALLRIRWYRLTCEVLR